MSISVSCRKKNNSGWSLFSQLNSSDGRITQFFVYSGCFWRWPVGLDGEAIDILDWVDQNTAPEGSQIIKDVRGLKFEVKQREGGIGDVSIRAIEFLDASGNVIDPVLITKMPGVRSEIAEAPASSDSPAGSSSSSMTDPNSSGAVTSGSSGVALPAFYAPARFNASVNGLQIQISAHFAHVVHRPRFGHEVERTFVVVDEFLCLLCHHAVVQPLAVPAE